MKTKVKIQFGTHGYFLVINNKAIKQDPAYYLGFKATELTFIYANNWIATEFATIKDLRQYWNNNRNNIIFATK
jgi:hypothetical protein